MMSTGAGVIPRSAFFRRTYMPDIRLLLLAVGAALALTAGPALADSEDSGTPAQEDAAKRGQEVFSSHGCGYCHENGGRTAGKGPQLMGTSRNDSFITFRIMNGKESKMPSFSGSIDGDQLADLIVYIRSLKD
jgi:mono/diheme cytochrome c family protein